MTVEMVSEGAGTGDAVSVMDSMYVVIEGVISVVTEPIRAGQSVIVEAQDVMTYVFVIQTIDSVGNGRSEVIVEDMIGDSVVAFQFLDEAVYVGKEDATEDVALELESPDTAPAELLMVSPREDE